MIAPRVEGVDCRQASRDYRCKGCHAWIRPSHWLASREEINPKTRKRSEIRYCESCAMSQGLAEASHARPSIRVCDLAPGARFVTPLGPRVILKRVRDHDDGRPQFKVASRGYYTGIYRFDSEQAAVILA